METKLCRICGKLGQNYVHIFKTEGLKNKIETCLPIIVSQHCLLPDTICGECSESVDNFYSFIKNCLQNIIILEAQYDITESCLKTKRKHEKGCHVDFITKKVDKNVQTNVENISSTTYPNFDIWQCKPYNSDTLSINHKKNNSLVDYDIDSDNSDNEECNGKVILTQKQEVLNRINAYVDNLLSTNNNFSVSKQYFDDPENNIITEITQRKSLKRKGDEIETQCPKIFKIDSNCNRRKNKQPKKLDYVVPFTVKDENSSQVYGQLDNLYGDDINQMNVYEQNGELKNENDFIKIEQFDLNEMNSLPSMGQVLPNPVQMLPQICLLCDSQFSGPAALASHVFETHGIDMAEVVSSAEFSPDKKKKLPNLVKISDLKKNESTDDITSSNDQLDVPPTLSPMYVCPNCPEDFSTKPDLFSHIRIKHLELAAFICGQCLHPTTSYMNLKSHIEICSQHHQISTRYYCQICLYGDDNFKSLENHVLVHTFLLDVCKKQSKMFDPADYIETNDSLTNSMASKNLNCSDCGLSDFESFKDFSAHRRSQHSIFHCDLCNKFYGRNSHLWKHVNRLHKGHPSITCQLCYKTSASKYHLSQHFNKIHNAKSCKQKNQDILSSDFNEDFMSQKFQAFDFQSVKQSFMKQEILEQERNKNISSEPDDSSNNRFEEEEEELGNSDNKGREPLSAPKEIDSTSDLYTNIITNYTPPANEGEFKCPKCSKGFHKKTLLKKHKKNCRPRLQKDLLTRCKSCARIFKDRQSLAKHLVNYHSEYACEICNQKVQSKCEIVSHIRFTHPNCHLVCKICGNILRSKQDLADHTRDHLNSYVCQFCADSLPSKIKLKMHILSLHRKILSLSCGVCLKLFETQHILRDHVRLVHKDQLAPLTSCPVCGKNYGSKWKTYDHLNKSHGRIFRACKTCLEIFDNDGQLQLHYETVHMNVVSFNKNNVNNLSQIVNNSVGTANDNGNFDSESDPENEDNSEEEEYNTEKTDSEEKLEYSSSLSSIPQDKISLLEKRLLGKKISDEDAVNLKNKSNSLPSLQKANNKNCDVINKPKKLESIKRELVEESNDNVVINSPNPQHNSSKRTVYVNSNDPSYCEICFKIWPAKKHLWQHYIRCHKAVAATVCGICLKTNPDYASLQLHLHENHPTLLHGQGFGSNFICRICGRYHNASSKLKLHMAIHENFNWSLLEEVANTKILDKKENKSDNVKQEPNGFKTENENIFGESGDINYESLIEQVECSSQSENEESEGGTTNDVKGEVETSSDDEDEDEESENESEEESENSLETQMLKNMLIEKQRMLKQDTPQSGNNENSQQYISSTEESSSSSFTDENAIKDENSSDEDSQSVSSQDFNKFTTRSNSTGDSILVNQDVNMIDGNIFRRKPEELDSAIKSISYECMNEVDEEEDDIYCDLQTHNSLNENEIESAVGSIL